ncbi:glycosyltransferase family 4 protein [Natronomonas gomsonensis]|uniref:glycosyltransferase family 4 protein n=1 Tax=Natronomonas gomsonensis TaxID=1046043 RepID=UPI001FEB6B35|nr:glycosyltransferase family 4 protein [Natronomonas gomsonensis]
MQLLEVLSAVTTVSLVTAHLSKNSSLRDAYETVEISDAPTGERLPTAAARFLRNQLRICRAVLQRDEDVILFFGSTSYLLPILFANLLGKTVVLQPRGNVPESLYQVWCEKLPYPIAYFASRLVWGLERLGYQAADAIITLSSGMADDLELGIHEEKLHRNGAWHVDTEQFRPITPYQERDRCLGYVGRLAEEKGIRELVDIVAELPTNIKFVFVGDGELRSWIADELATEINAGRVEITGWVNHNRVPELLNQFRLLVMTSRTEGLPTTILESMACGTPVCARPVSGVTDVVLPGMTGYLLKEETPPEAAERIVSVLEATSTETSDECRTFAEEEYSFAAAIERYESILSTL